jgi:dihydrolipoamide dehydrogenase
MGVVAVEAMAGQHPAKLDYLAMPRCTYSTPQIASIGLTEDQCKAQAMGETYGMIKIISDTKHGQILGAHLVGPEVVEMIGEFSVLLASEGTLHELIQAVHPHPTLSEAIAEAALAVEGAALNA